MTILHEKRSDEFSIYPIGDIHLGAASCDEELLKQTVARIQADPLAYWIGMGDYIDAINMRDPRFEAGGLAAWLYDPLSMQDIIGAQLRRAERYLAPIADRCLGLIGGNHEGKAAKWSEREVMTLLARMIAEHREDRANLALGYAGFIRLSFREQHPGGTARTTGTLTIYAHHGAGASSTPGGKINRLLKTMAGIQADLVLMGHVHDERHHRRTLLSVNGRGRVIRREQIGIITGTYLGQSAYAVERGYPPPTMGSPVVRYAPDRARLRVDFPGARIAWEVA